MQYRALKWDVRPNPERPDEKCIGLITLNRPKALNALSDALIRELGRALDDYESDPSIGAIVITGNEKAFAAGADIKEMQAKTFPDTFVADFITDGWERVSQCRKPIVAAVAAFAPRGGGVVALMCDFLLAAWHAHFGPPGIKICVTPGAGRRHDAGGAARPLPR